MAQVSEETYRIAYLKWRTENPGDIQPTVRTVVKINGKEINIGKRIQQMRGIYREQLQGKRYGTSKPLTEEQIEWWTSNGIDLGYTKAKSVQIQQDTIEIMYRKAYLKWKAENSGETQPLKTTIVEIEGVEIALGDRIRRMRAIYRAQLKGERYSTNLPLTEEQISWWTSNGLDLNYTIESIHDEKESQYRKAYLKWKKDNLNDVQPSENVIVDIDGKKVYLGKRVQIMRQVYQAQLKGTRYGTYSPLTPEQIEWWTSNGLDLNYVIEKINEEKESQYRYAYQIWKEEHPDEVIPSRTVMIRVNGVKINLGSRIRVLRAIYKAQLKGELYYDRSPLSEEQIEYWLNVGVLSDILVKEEGLEEQLESVSKSKRQKVSKCLANLRAERNKRKKPQWDINNILQEFDVDIAMLTSYLNRVSNRTTTPSSVLYYKGQTLRSFCMENGYNYDVIARAVRLHQFCTNDTLDQLINRAITSYKTYGQQDPATWVYERYGMLVKHILLSIHLDSEAIIREMTKNIISLEEAISHQVFLKHRKVISNAWLEEPFNYIIEEVDSDNKTEAEMVEDVVAMFQLLIKEYELDPEEINVLWNAFKDYVTKMNGYYVSCVGLETDIEKKKKLIEQYKLDEDSIRESFFVPLMFDKGVLIGKQRKLYTEREKFKEYLANWDRYTEVEKEMILSTLPREDQKYFRDTVSKVEEVKRKS